MNTKYTGPIKEVEVVEKTVLTAEQAHEFEAFKKLRNSLEDWAHDKSDPNATYSIIHELTFDEMARAYLIGYEIEPEQPEFQPGDKVFVDWIDGGKVHQVAAVKNHGQVILQRDYALNCLPLMEVVRLATEEEIYWLETLGREKVGEFREGDVFVADDAKLIKLTDEFLLRIAKRWYEKGLCRGIYPADSFRPFKKEPE